MNLKNWKTEKLCKRLEQIQRLQAKNGDYTFCQVLEAAILEELYFRPLKKSAVPAA